MPNIAGLGAIPKNDVSICKSKLYPLQFYGKLKQL